MKSIKLSLLLLLGAAAVYGQSSTTSQSTTNQKVYESVENEPAFPGGMAKFYTFIQLKLQNPEVASLVGINGKVRVSFVVGKDGVLKNIRALDTIGFGCEEEAVRVITASPRWSPAMQNSIPVDVKFTVPITFAVSKETLSVVELKKSNYAFIFEIKGTIYTIDEAAKILGKSIPQDHVDKVIPYADKQKYPLAGKKDIYLIKIRS